MLIDTHCHVDLPAFDEDRAAVFDRAVQAGVKQLILIGFNPERWVSSARLAAATPGICLAFGLHPNDAALYDPAFERDLAEAVAAHGAIAIGETGLDYHWHAATPEQQRRAFQAQIALAKSLDLPFIVHQRKAAEDVLAILAASDPPHRGVMHCFTEDLRYAERCLQLGMHLGIGGAVTYRKSRAVHEVAALAPLDRLVLETDAPFMAPSPHRGERNEPAHLVLIAGKIAELRGVSTGEIERATSANAERLFRLDGTRLARLDETVRRDAV